MAKTGNNLIGEPLEKFVYDEFKNRQTNQYSGLDKNSLRSPHQQQYLNNTNGWVKLASSVEVGVDNKDTESNEKILGTQRLQSVGLNPSNFLGNQLSKKFIIFNGVSELGKPNIRAGISNNKNLWNDKSTYGLGGTEFGIQPMPGIQSISVKSLNRGSIRRATIELKAYNKFQFEIIELLYLRIGYHVMLEWGNDKYYNPSSSSTENINNTIIEDSWFKQDNVTQLEMIRKINDYRETYSGNYDGFFGRVVNFNWSFEKDGSYSISIELVTVGDLIESLNVNLPANMQSVVKLKQEATTGEEKILNENLDNLLDEWLYNQKASSIALASIVSDSTTATGDEDDTLDYSNFSILDETKDYFTFTDDNLYTDEERDEILEDKGELPFDKYVDYVRLGKFFEILENFCIPIQKGDGDIGTDKKGEHQILLNYNESQFISYHPNQISLDPKICIIKPKPFSGEETEGIFYPSYLEKLLPYHIQEGDMEAGKLMNIYLNFHFITSTLKKNINNKGELSLFRYIQSICDGLTLALGNVNNLEPVLKEDKILNIIDQNPIPGVIEHMESEVEDIIIPLEIYGYNKTTKQSTFVTDISFNTSITPELGAMMTIGATAGGSTVKGTDATAFSKWNAGLQDRFNRDIKYNESDFSVINQTELRQAQEDAAKHFKQVTSINKIGRAIKYLFSSSPSSLFLARAAYQDQKQDLKKVYSKNGIPEGDYTLPEYVEAAGKNYKYEQRRKATKNKLADSARYLSYLGSAFGGSQPIQTGDFKFFNPPNKEDSKYLKFDDAFISKGRTSYKSYLSDLNNRAYKKAEASAKKIKDLFSSNQNGFIPIKLDITLQGISGIKIYNKLNIDQSFLPDNYPDSIHFIVTNVDHNLANNVWTTALSTISIPKTNPKDVYKLEPLSFKGDFVEYSDIKGVLPFGERGPKYNYDSNYPQGYFLPFEYIEGRNHPWRTGGDSRGRISQEDILKQIHPEVRENFRNFFNELDNEYKGFSMIINSTGRTWEDSLRLQKKNPKNADPGKSTHNYQIAIDINIVTAGSSISSKLLKKDTEKSEWINYGIPDVAQKHGILWGGNINGYYDPVHFYFNLAAADTNKNELYKRWVSLAPSNNYKELPHPFEVPIYKDIK